MDLYINAKYLQWYKVSNFISTFENVSAQFKNCDNVVDLKINLCIDYSNRLIMIYNINHSCISYSRKYRPILLESTKDMFYDLKKLHDWNQLRVFIYGDYNFFNNYRLTFSLHPFNDITTNKKYKY